MRRIVVAIVLIAVIVLTGFGARYLFVPGTYPGTPVPITLGEKPYESSGLIYIAQAQGLFAANGLTVTMRDYDSAPSAISGLLNDEVDMVLTSEYVVVAKSFEKGNIGVIGNIDKYQTTYLFGRQDRGIESLSDLKGKKVGITRGGIGEFFLGRLLSLNGMRMQDLALVDMPPTQYVQALANGTVDALITGIYIDQIQDQLGSKIVVWPAQSSQDSFWVISSRGDWAASHPQQINRLLKSLDQAEAFYINHPDEAKAIVQKRLNLSDAYMAAVWSEHHYSLSLDRSLVLAMEDEARWMMSNRLTDAQQIPAFLEHVYEDGLKKVRPDAVNILR